MSEYLLPNATQENDLKKRWYETGYQDGESSVTFDWDFGLDDLDIPHEGECLSPRDVVAEIERLRKSRRKLARWLPFALPLIEQLWRPDMPEHLIHDNMSPEDWIAAAEEAVKR